MRCDLCGGPIRDERDRVTVGPYKMHTDCVQLMIESEHERRGVRQAEQDFASYHGGTAPYPFTEAERQEEQERIRRLFK